MSANKNVKRMFRARMKTIMSKLMELQDIERREGLDLLPSSTEGFIQDLTGPVYEED